MAKPSRNETHNFEPPKPSTSDERLTALEAFNPHVATKVELQTEVSDLRAEMRAGFADIRAEMHAEFADIRAEMRAGLAEMRIEFAKIRTELATMRAEAEARDKRNMRWMISFIVASNVAIIAAVGGLAVAILQLIPG